jgi:hypothetical protein
MNKHLFEAIFVIIALVMIFPIETWAGSDRGLVQVNGDRLTVRAENITMRDLLMSVSEKTGVEFIMSEGLAEEYVSLDFEGLPLVIGIEKIVHSYNHAAINDETGKLSKVYIFSKGKDGFKSASVVTTNQEGKSVSRDAAREMSQPKDQQHSKQMGPQSPSFKKDSRYFPGPPVDQPYTGGGPPLKEMEFMPGPPNTQGPDRPPPMSEMKEMAGPPDIHMPKSSPPPNSETGRQ